MAAEPAGGVYDDHHNFFCSLDSSSSTTLDATTVNVLTIFKWEGGGEGGVKDDGYCIDKDRDGVHIDIVIDDNHNDGVSLDV